MTKIMAMVAICGFALVWSPASWADVNIPGLGSGAYDVPSVGGPGDKVDKAPICDNRARPKITKVTPDPVKPGEKITIKGENFGTKECFHNVSFGTRGTDRDEAKINFKYIDETTVEAVVPDLKPGLTPMNLLTSGGSSQSILLIQEGGASRPAQTGSAKQQRAPNSSPESVQPETSKSPAEPAAPKEQPSSGPAKK
jgi:hypothetical protein